MPIPAVNCKLYMHISVSEVLQVSALQYFFFKPAVSGDYCVPIPYVLLYIL